MAGLVRSLASVSAALMASAAVTVGLAPSALASCVPPTVVVSPAMGAPGASVRVTGSYWASDCNDTGGPAPAPETVRIYFRQGDTRQFLIRRQASADYELAATIAVPENARPGPAQIEAQGPHLGTYSAAFHVTGVSAPTLPFTGQRGEVQAFAVGSDAITVGLLLLLAGRPRRRNLL